MALSLGFVRQLLGSNDRQAWETVLAWVWEICGGELDSQRAPNEVAHRDRSVGDLDLLLGGATWELWNSLTAVAPRAADLAADWWASRTGGRAVLVLDGLSLREVPWLLGGADRHGFRVRELRIATSELPSETTAFARALGFPQRSALENGGGQSGRFSGAWTETTRLPWRDCIDLLPPRPDILFWHHRPDAALHQAREAGKGLTTLTAELAPELSGDDFWSFLERLGTGRDLLITSDHGYATTGQFLDAPPGPMTEYLRNHFRAGRSAPTENLSGSPWVPPLDLALTTRAGQHRMVVGRRKWKVAGGYPTLTHGGLSALEVAVPLLELSRV